jgi:hypothetical protein
MTMLAATDKAIDRGIGAAGERHLAMLDEVADGPWHRVVDIAIAGRRAIAEERPRDKGALGMFYAAVLNRVECDGPWFGYLAQLRNLVHHIAEQERLRPEDLLSSDWKAVSEAVVLYPSNRELALEKLADMARAERDASVESTASIDAPKGP